MTKYIRVDDDQDFDWLSDFIADALFRNPGNVNNRPYYMQLVNWSEYLANAMNGAKALADQEIPVDLLVGREHQRAQEKLNPKPKPVRPRVKKKTNKRIPKADRTNHFGCDAHPTYGVKYSPRSDCARCWELYKQFHPLEYPQARARFLRKQKEKNL